MINILIVFGTRPEALKLYPLIQELNKQKKYFNITICSTGQHKDLLHQNLKLLNIKPDYELGIMKKNQNLFDITRGIMYKMPKIFLEVKPDLILVHGDTTTAFSAALAGFYAKIKVGHIESGLRTWDINSPWPEEANRQLIDKITSLYFAPTLTSAQNLIKDGCNKKNVFVTGNTIIDTLVSESSRIKRSIKSQARIKNEFADLGLNFDHNRKLLLITSHRRENFGKGLSNIVESIKKLSSKYPLVDFVFLVHPNPQVKLLIESQLQNILNVKLIKPINYEQLIFLMMQSYLILTDSGGLQEEAPTFKKPVLIMRTQTERPEAVENGIGKLVGTSKQKIISETSMLLENKKYYQSMVAKKNPFGDGKASIRIVKVLLKEYGLKIN
jgi:UDP-N-acetylglucosamine 2-epimerase (non-hydrolysing)